MKQSIYERYCILRDRTGVKDAKVATDLSIPKSTFSEWKKGKYVPKAEKLQKIADYFGVSISYLMDGVEESQHQADYNGYYLNDETARVAQEIFEDRDLRILFDAARDSSPDDLRMAADLLRRLKGDR